MPRLRRGKFNVGIAGEREGQRRRMRRVQGVVCDDGYERRLMPRRALHRRYPQTCKQVFHGNADIVVQRADTVSPQPAAQRYPRESRNRLRQARHSEQVVRRVMHRSQRNRVQSCKQSKAEPVVVVDNLRVISLSRLRGRVGVGGGGDSHRLIQAAAKTLQRAQSAELAVCQRRTRNVNDFAAAESEILRSYHRRRQHFRLRREYSDNGAAFGDIRRDDDNAGRTGDAKLPAHIGGDKRRGIRRTRPQIRGDNRRRQRTQTLHPNQVTLGAAGRNINARSGQNRDIVSLLAEGGVNHAAAQRHAHTDARRHFRADVRAGDKHGNRLRHCQGYVRARLRRHRRGIQRVNNESHRRRQCAETFRQCQFAVFADIHTRGRADQTVTIRRNAAKRRHCQHRRRVPPPQCHRRRAAHCYLARMRLYDCGEFAVGCLGAFVTGAQSQSQQAGRVCDCINAVCQTQPRRVRRVDLHIEFIIRQAAAGGDSSDFNRRRHARAAGEVADADNDRIAMTQNSMRRGDDIRSGVFITDKRRHRLQNRNARHRRQHDIKPSIGDADTDSLSRLRGRERSRNRHRAVAVDIVPSQCYVFVCKPRGGVPDRENAQRQHRVLRGDVCRAREQLFLQVARDDCRREGARARIGKPRAPRARELIAETSAGVYRRDRPRSRGNAHIGVQHRARLFADDEERPHARVRRLRIQSRAAVAAQIDKAVSARGAHRHRQCRRCCARLGIVGDDCHREHANGMKRQCAVYARGNRPGRHHRQTRQFVKGEHAAAHNGITGGVGVNRKHRRRRRKHNGQRLNTRIRQRPQRNINKSRHRRKRHSLSRLRGRVGAGGSHSMPGVNNGRRQFKVAVHRRSQNHRRAVAADNRKRNSGIRRSSVLQRRKAAVSFNSGECAGVDNGITRAHRKQTHQRRQITARVCRPEHALASGYRRQGVNARACRRVFNRRRRAAAYPQHRNRRQRRQDIAQSQISGDNFRRCQRQSEQHRRLRLIFKILAADVLAPRDSRARQ